MSRCRYHPPSRPQARCIAAVSNSPALGSGVATQGSPRIREPHGSEGRDELFAPSKARSRSRIPPPCSGSASVDFPRPRGAARPRRARPPEILVVDFQTPPPIGKKDRRDRAVSGNAIVLLHCDTEAAGGFIYCSIVAATKNKVSRTTEPRREAGIQY